MNYFSDLLQRISDLSVAMIYISFYCSSEVNLEEKNLKTMFKLDRYKQVRSS